MSLSKQLAFCVLTLCYKTLICIWNLKMRFEEVKFIKKKTIIKQLIFQCVARNAAWSKVSVQFQDGKFRLIKNKNNQAPKLISELFLLKRDFSLRVLLFFGKWKIILSKVFYILRFLQTSFCIPIPTGSNSRGFSSWETKWTVYWNYEENPSGTCAIGNVFVRTIWKVSNKAKLIMQL